MAACPASGFTRQGWVQFEGKRVKNAGALNRVKEVLGGRTVMVFIALVLFVVIAGICCAGDVGA